MEYSQMDQPSNATLFFFFFFCVWIKARPPVDTTSLDLSELMDRVHCICTCFLLLIHVNAKLCFGETLMFAMCKIFEVIYLLSTVIGYKVSNFLSADFSSGALVPIFPFQ